MSDKDWYNRHWEKKETQEFNEWFAGEYGNPGGFVSEPEEQYEYYVRKAFALMGWLGREKLI